MKLTKEIKDAIIAAVMQDTPESFTYDQYVDGAMKIAVGKLPKKVRAVYDDKELRSFIRNAYYRGVYIPILDNNVAIPEIDELRAKCQAAQEERDNLRSHVRDVVYQFSTDKQMIQHIPELEKYLPKGAEKTMNLPASNMIAELVKAGWPKDKKKGVRHG